MSKDIESEILEAARRNNFGEDPYSIRPDQLGHRTRMSDSSRYDERCITCGATDAPDDDALRKRCSEPLPERMGGRPELPPFYSLRAAAVDGVSVWLVEMSECYSFMLPPCSSREEAIGVAWSTFRDYGDRKWHDWIMARSPYDLS